MRRASRLQRAARPWRARFSGSRPPPGWWRPWRCAPAQRELGRGGPRGCAVMAVAIAALGSPRTTLCRAGPSTPCWPRLGARHGRDPLLGRGLLLRADAVSLADLYAFWFFSKRAAFVHAALIGALFAVELADRDPAYTPAAEWAATVLTARGDRDAVAVVRDRLSDVISNLSDAARRDPLTGLLNRRGFEEVFEVELERARRTEQALSVIVGDLDRFKEVNDALRPRRRRRGAAGCRPRDR